LSTPVARVARGASVLGARSASSDEGGSMMVGRVSFEMHRQRKSGEKLSICCFAYLQRNRERHVLVP